MLALKAGMTSSAKCLRSGSDDGKIAGRKFTPSKEIDNGNQTTNNYEISVFLNKNVSSEIFVLKPLNKGTFNYFKSHPLRQEHKHSH
jgi:hypothetical protein